MAVVWLVLGVVLLVAELRHFAFYALFGAIGAFAAALVAAVLPDQVVLQLLAGVAVGGLGIWLVRPLVSTRFHRSGDDRLGRGVHGSLVGEEVVTLDPVGPGHTGHVLLAGESWLAISGSDAVIPARTDVLVTAIQGTTLIVWPVDGYTFATPDIFADTPSIDPADAAGSTRSNALDAPETARRDTPGPVGGEATPAPDHSEGEQP